MQHVSDKSRLIAFLLCFFFGGLGVHRFYVGKVGTGILEYVIGLYCLKISHTKLWDYTGLFLNIQGLVCLRSIITFGIGGLILIYIIDPLLEKIVLKMKQNTKLAICSTFILIFITDIILSIKFRTPPGP